MLLYISYLLIIGVTAAIILLIIRNEKKHTEKKEENSIAYAERRDTERKPLRPGDRRDIIRTVAMILVAIALSLLFSVAAAWLAEKIFEALLEATCGSCCDEIQKIGAIG
jgi:uncharacterized membrane protein SirB2